MRIDTRLIGVHALRFRVGRSGLVRSLRGGAIARVNLLAHVGMSQRQLL
jgi:hypothetical protein